jgi:RNA polymerase sigma factor (sigma-70 family)
VEAAGIMEEQELDVPACLILVRQGDEDAASSLVRHLHPLVLKLVRAHRPKREGEEDMVQKVFAKMFAKLDQFSGKVPLAHWVSRIAVNTCLNQIAGEKARPELRYADLSEEEEKVLTALAHNELEQTPAESLASRDLVEKLLARLAPDDRLVIHWLHLENRSVEDVRALTGWSAALVKIRAFRARAKMRKHLRHLLKEQANEGQ